MVQCADAFAREIDRPSHIYQRDTPIENDGIAPSFSGPHVRTTCEEWKFSQYRIEMQFVVRLQNDGHTQCTFYIAPLAKTTGLL